jgi:aspartate racemase
MVTVHHRRPPVAVNDDFSPVLPLRPDPELLRAAARLADAGADFLVMTANGAHLFHKAIEDAAGKPLLSMIDVTVAEVRRRGWRTVGALAFMDHRAEVYARPLRDAGLACETIDPALQARLNDAIFRTMEGRETDEHRAAAREAVDSLRARGVHGVIPGCTEIPLLLGPDADTRPDLVNPAALLAEAAVARAMAP